MIAPAGPIGVVGWIALALVAALLVVIVLWREAPFLVTIAIAGVSVAALVLRGGAL